MRWKTAASIGADRPSVSLWVCPIKDVAGRHVRQEIPIAAMHVDGESDDPLCTYSCLLRRWRRHAVHLSVQERRRTPLFQLPGGAPYCTDDVDRLVERVVVFLGLDPKLYGAVSLRIAGATDLRDALGMAGADLIKARGRWSSDIGFIYQLVTEAEMLEASVSMMAAERPERARNTGVAQPAVRRRYWYFTVGRWVALLVFRMWSGVVQHVARGEFDTNPNRTLSFHMHNAARFWTSP